MRTSSQILDDTIDLVYEHPYYSTIAITSVIDLIALYIRFNYGIKSDFRVNGWRIHHGYVGLGLFATGALLFEEKKKLKSLLKVVGASLILSDLIYHYGIMLPITGSPELTGYFGLIT